MEEGVAAARFLLVGVVAVGEEVEVGEVEVLRLAALLSVLLLLVCLERRRVKRSGVLQRRPVMRGVLGPHVELCYFCSRYVLNDPQRLLHLCSFRTPWRLRRVVMTACAYVFSYASQFASVQHVYSAANSVHYVH